MRHEIEGCPILISMPNNTSQNVNILFDRESEVKRSVGFYLILTCQNIITLRETGTGISLLI